MTNTSIIEFSLIYNNMKISLSMDDIEPKKLWNIILSLKDNEQYVVHIDIQYIS